MIRRARSVVPSLVLASLAVVPALSSSEIPFSSEIAIEDPFTFAISAASADLDGDGDLDLIAASRDDDDVAWWENTAGDGTTWSRHDVDVAFNGAREVAVGDLDGDGDLDIVATAFDDDLLSWWENDLGSGAVCGLDFCEHTIEALNGATAVVVVDLDRDGDRDVVATSRNGMLVRWYANAGDATSWTAQTIGTLFDGAQVLRVGDLDGDGDLDVLGGAGNAPGAFAWWENDLGSLTACGSDWCPHSLDTGITGGLAIGNLDGDGDLDLVRSETGSVSWWENDAGDASSWSETAISTVTARLGLAALDVDGDGDLDLVGLQNGSWLENVAGNASSWVERSIPGAPTDVFDLEPADLDGDGDLDFAAARGSVDRLSWWRNETLHRTAQYPVGLDVGAALDAAADVVAADLDGDGDDDLVATAPTGVLRWSENDGSPLDGGWTDRTIATSAGPEGLVAADLDGDGDLDLAVCEVGNDRIRWFENDGTPDDGWSAHTVGTSLGAAFYVAAGDLDGDGDLDLVATSRDGDEVQWYENDGTPADGSWTNSTVASGLDFPQGIALADVDGDGDLDVVAAAKSDNVVVWVENDGAPADGGWTRHDVASFSGAYGVAACDLDRDGDMDLVATAQVANDVAWFESDGGAVPVWTAHTINGSLGGARLVRCADLDRDGDVDVVATGASADDVRVWFSDGSPADGGWTQVIVDGAFDNAYGLAIADLDRDGQLDLVATASSGDLVRWWAGTGGQFALPTADAVTTTDPNPGDADVLLLEIDGAHRGRSGDADWELATLVLWFVDEAADPITGSQLDALVDTVRLYLDDGDGIFEPDTDDTNFFSLGSPFPDPAVLELAMVDGDPSVQVAFGADVTWWVAVDLAVGAAGATPDAFRLVHVNRSGLIVPMLSTGEMSTTDLPLELEEPDIVVVSSVIDVNDPPALDSPIDDDATHAGAAYSYDVGGFFSDPEGGMLSFDASGLPLSLSISSGGVITGTPTVAEASGSPYSVTITATDQGGLTAMGSFELTVLPGSTIVVDGTCTLIDAILSANNDMNLGDCTGAGGAETIVLDVDVTLFVDDTFLSSELEDAHAGLPDIFTEMRIEAGLGSTITRDTSLTCLSDGVDRFRLFNVVAGGGLTLVGVTLENGCAPRGGAVLVTGTGASLDAIDTTFRANVAQAVVELVSTAEGGALVLSNDTELSLDGCLFEDNGAFGVAGGSGRGGAIRLRNGVNPVLIAGTDFVGNEAVGSDNSPAGGGARGGAIESLRAVELSDVMFVGNEARGGGSSTGSSGGAAEGGAIGLAGFSASQILGAVFEDNRAIGGDSPAGSGGSARGGAIDALSSSSLSVFDVLIVGGGAFGGDGVTGGVAKGGGLALDSLRVTRVTIVGAEASGGNGSSGNGGNAQGGGIFSHDELALDQVTLSGNLAVGGDSMSATGGAGEGGGAMYDDDSGTLGHLTAVGNSAVGGMGVVPGTAAGGGVRFTSLAEMVSSILADNTSAPGGGSATADDCSTTDVFDSLGYNVVETPGTCTFAATGDQSSVDPGALALGRYGCGTPLPDGGCLPVHPIALGGAAVDQGSCTVALAAGDARGFARPFDVTGIANADDGCDAGAYEVQDVNGNGIDDGFEIFADGFETGDTSAWSATVP